MKHRKTGLMMCVRRDVQLGKLEKKKRMEEDAKG